MNNLAPRDRGNNKDKVTNRANIIVGPAKPCFPLGAFALMYPHPRRVMGIASRVHILKAKNELASEHNKRVGSK